MRSVRAKLLSLFAIVLIFVFALGWTGLSQIKQVSDFTDEVTDHWLRGTETILQANLKIEQFLGNYYQSLSVKDADQLKQLAEARTALVSAIDEDIKQYEKTLAGEEDVAQYEVLVQAWSQFQQDLAKTADPNATKEEAAAAMADVSQSFGHLKSVVEELIVYNHEGADNSKNESKAVYEATSGVLFFLGIGILVVVGVLAWWLITNLTRPLRATTAVMNRISAGDLRVDLLRIDRKDEFGVMMESVNKTVLALRQSVQQMQDASTSVATASAQLYASSEQNSEAARHVSESINQVAAGSEEQASTAAECGRVIDEMAEGVQRIAETTGEVSERMQRLSETVEQAGQTIVKLEEQSAQISEISGLIGEIAYRTNLLALNAAIEAARAGEHGKGFAVVAGEVRKLASQSDESSKGIIELIATIQKDTLDAAEAMRLSLQEVQEGVLAVDHAEQAFQEIVSSTGEVSTRIQEAAAAAEQLAASSEEVAASISNMGHIARQTAGMSQQVAATTEEQQASSEEMTRSSQTLSDISKDLQKLVRQFTT